MRFDVITLFPELFAPFLSIGITRRAFESKSVDVRLWNPRDFAQGTYRRIDDRPFGGGPGMVMMAEPLRLCLESIQTERQQTRSAPVVLFSPIGETLKHCNVEAHYTRPEVWQGQAVPDVLLSGHHLEIERWRQVQRRKLTTELRPDLLKKPQ